ncbi:MAG: hypothetical protein QCH31_11985 [Methanolobus sp.]|nr:hypothetical protein [Methanolobus sp.]
MQPVLNEVVVLTSVKVRVNVLLLQMDEGRFEKGDAVTLPLEKVKQLGTSVSIVAEEPYVKPPKPEIVVEDKVQPISVEEEPVASEEPKRYKSRKTAV